MKATSRLAFITFLDEGSPSHMPAPPQGPVDPGFGVPLPPVVSHPIEPGGSPPNYPIGPNQDLPTAPGVFPMPPIAGPPVAPSHPIIVPPDDVPPGAVWPPLPDSLPSKILALVWIVGVGYRWAVLDLDADVAPPIAEPPEPTPT